MGEKDGRAFFEALAAGQAQMHSGYTNVSQLLAAGEFPLALCRAHRIEKMREAGAPVDWVSTVNPLLADLHPVGLASRAPPIPMRGNCLLTLSSHGKGKISRCSRDESRPGPI